VSEPSLPDDPGRWPTDPHELLGVPRDVGPRDLRRAYTRLIRTYKPEQFPEQFRRIRAAYEAAVRLAEFFAAGGEPGASAPGEADKPPVADAPGSPERLAPPRPFDPADDAHALWELAAAGHAARGYAGLADLFRRRPDQPDLPLRLYWLLALDQELDPGRDPCTWLADALRLGGLAGPAAELFRRELDERPAEALAAGEAVADVEAPTDRLAGYLAARGGAAAQLRRWDVLRADLERARGRVRPTDEVSWLRLVLAAVDHLVWAAGDPAGGSADADALLSECRREVAALGHLAVQHAEAFDRLEFLTAATTGWAGLRDGRTLPADLLDLLPLAWVRPFPEVRPLVADVLGQVAAAPAAWLKHLDALAEFSPAALAMFAGLLGQYQDRLPEPPPIPHPPADLARLVAEFIRDNRPWEYPMLRPRLLAFCLREAVGAELVAVVAPTASARAEELQRAIMADWPLRHVCWACRLFWA
jgi:hypothetical protein